MMNDIFSSLGMYFSYKFVIFAFIVGVLVSLCASLLGVTLVLRRCSMIGDGLSHVAFGALAVATVLGAAPLAFSLPAVVIAAILRANNTIRVDAQFRFRLITVDPDDNKFVDCAIVSNAEYIVTNDTHFDCLADIPFPHVDIRSIDEFLEELLWMDSNA